MQLITLPPGYVPTAIPAPEPVASPLSTGAPPPAPAPAPAPAPEPEPLPFGYTLTAGAAVQRSDGALVPADPANPAWQEYQRWLAAGHTAAPYVAPPAVVTVPDRVTMRQARLALHAAGKLALVEAAIDALPEPPKAAARIEWDHSQEVHRNRPFVQMLGQGLNLTSQQLDELFILAATL